MFYIEDEDAVKDTPEVDGDNNANDNEEEADTDSEDGEEGGESTNDAPGTENE